MMNVLVIGAGYVGVANAILLSKRNNVYINDIDKDKLAKIEENDFSFINEKMEKGSTNDLSLQVSHNKSIAENCEVVIIALPTDLNGKGKLDYNGIIRCLREIRSLNPKIDIIIKSTLPVGSCKIIQSEFGDFFYMPEFLREGYAVYDVHNPDRIIVGSTGKDVSLIKTLYGTNHKAIYTGFGEAELIKLFSNTYLALRVSFFNEMDTIIQSENLESIDVLNGVCSDKRIGNYYNNPSFGYGGYCLPKDTKEIESVYSMLDLPLISNITKSNDKRIKDVCSDIIGKGYKKIGVYNLFSKSESMSTKESSTIKLIDLLKHHVEIFIYGESITSVHCKIEKSLKELYNNVDIIIANRVDEKLKPFLDKVYTRDIYGRN